MPAIQILGTDLPYEATDIITFEEGLIGFPELKQLVLVRQTSVEPFLWLAAIDDPEIVFLVADPRPIFPAYEKELLEAAQANGLVAKDESPLVLAISLIAPDWTESKINLRAPLFISPSTMHGVQFVLSDSSFSANEPFPQESMAA